MRRSSVEDLKPVKVIEGGDNDELVVLARTYNQMIDRLGLGIKKQKEFIANASYELKTPLANAISTLDLAQMDLADRHLSPLPGRLQQTKSDLISLTALIAQLLELSRLNQSTLSVRFNLQSEIKKILSQFEPDLKNKQLTLDISDNLVIYFPPSHFSIILSNLLSNAIKYTPLKGQILISFHQSSLVIQDSGIGLTQDEIQHLFGRFFRSPKVRGHISGSGLGLSLVKEICDLNQLDISVKSQPDLGTTFTLSGFKT